MPIENLNFNFEDGPIEPMNKDTQIFGQWDLLLVL